MSQYHDRRQLLARIQESLGGSSTFKQLDDMGTQLSRLGSSIAADVESEFDQSIARQESSAA